MQGESGLLQEVPDLVEYPSVIAGTFAHEFLELPEEVLTTTLIHHQHYFPVEAEDGTLKNAFLAVINTEPNDERAIARNAEHVVTARLRDARFFWEADRKTALDSRVDRLATLLFHKALGSYERKAERIEQLAGWIAERALDMSKEVAAQAARAARLSKADLTTDMVRELTELQGMMGGDLRASRRRTGGRVEGDVLSLPADQCRGGRAADSCAARLGDGDLGRRFARRQTGYTRRPVCDR